MPRLLRYRKSYIFYSFCVLFAFMFLFTLILMRSLSLETLARNKDVNHAKNVLIGKAKKSISQVREELPSHNRVKLIDDDYVGFLKLWKKTYNNEKESFNSKVNLRRNRVDFDLHNWEGYNQSSEVIEDTLNLHVYQLSNLEEVREKIIDDSNWKRTTDYVRSIIEFNQNPPNCKLAKKVICNPQKACGFACQFHHLMYCFTVALAKGKVLWLSKTNWNSFNSIENVFRPLSTSCSSEDMENQQLNEHVQIIDAAEQAPFLPQAVPAQILMNISSFHTAPFTWWIGQLGQYLFRFQPYTQQYIKSKNFSIQSPIVGIHIRRTDKIGTEAEFYDLSQYMYWVMVYFEKVKIKQNLTQKYVYLATDEEGVLEAAQKRYPDYVFISNKEATLLARTSRSSKKGTLGIISDIYYLSLTDYLVCTFSSQVCRLAYELMNGRRKDASENFKSIDEIYYFGGQIPRDFEVHIPHVKRNKDEVNVPVKTKFNLRHNDWNGYSKVEDVGEHSGHLPSYKIHENPISHPFHVFDHYERSLNPIS